MTVDVFEIQSKYAKVGEGAGGSIDPRVDALVAEINDARGGEASVDARLDGIDTAVGGNTTAVNTVTNEVTTARGGEANLDTRLDGIDTDVTTVTNEVILGRGGEESLDARFDLIEAAAELQPGMFMALSPLDINGDLIDALRSTTDIGETGANLHSAYTPGDATLVVEFGWNPSPVNGYYWIRLGTGVNARVIEATTTNGRGPFWEIVTHPTEAYSTITFTKPRIDASNPLDGGGVWPIGTPVEIVGEYEYIQVSGRDLIPPGNWTESTALVAGTTIDKAVVDAALLPAGTDALGLMVIINELAP